MACIAIGFDIFIILAISLKEEENQSVLSLFCHLILSFYWCFIGGKYCYVRHREAVLSGLLIGLQKLQGSTG